VLFNGTLIQTDLTGFHGFSLPLIPNQNIMINLFLRAKHWQLFIFILGIPLIFQLYLMNSMFSEITTGDPEDLTFMVDFMKYYPIVMILVMGVLFGWMWSISIGLRQKIPMKIRPKTKLFKIFFFIPLLYLVGITYLVSTFFSGITGISYNKYSTGYRSLHL
jgi:hypothetical protein